jgi:hypothetical protein
MAENNGGTPPSGASGSDIVKLGISVDAMQPEQAAEALDKMAAATVPAAAGLDRVSQAATANAAAIGESNKQLQAHIAKINEEAAAATKTAETEKELERVRLAAIDNAVNQRVKLEELIVTFGLSREELLRYQAAQIGLTEVLEPLIKRLEELRLEQEQLAIQQKRDIELAEARAKATRDEIKEKEALAAEYIKFWETALAAQDKAYAEQVALEQKRDTELNAMRAKQAADAQKQREKDAAEYIKFWEIQTKAQEDAFLKQEALAAKAEAARQKRLDREIAQLLKQREQAGKDYVKWWEGQAAVQEAAQAASLARAEKFAIDEIEFKRKSLKQQIDLIQHFNELQAAGISEDAISKTLRNSAVVGQTSNLPRLMQQYEDELKKLEAAHKSGHAVANSFADAFGNISFQSSRARSEIIVLIHEMLQGRFTRVPASMLVLAEYTNAASLAFSGMGIVALGTLGTLAVLGVALVKGAQEQTAFNSAVILTGHYAGVSGSALEDMGRKAAGLHGSIGDAKKAVLELANSGKFTADQIMLVASAAVDIEHATGKSTENTIKEFETLAVQAGEHSNKFSDKVSSALLKLSDHYHFLTLDVFEHVRALEREGDQRGAAALAMDTYAEAIKKRVPEIEANLGLVERAWNKIKRAGSEAIDSVLGIGKTTNAAEEVARLTRERDALEKQGTGDIPGKSTADNERKRIERLTQANYDLLAAQTKLDEENAKARENALKAETQSRATHAAQALINQGIQIEKKSLGELNIALREYGQRLTDLAAQDPNDPMLSQDVVNARFAAIIKEHTPKPPKNPENDGRKQILRAGLDAAEGEYQVTKLAVDNNLKLLKQAVDSGIIGNDVYHDRVKQDLADELLALEASYRKKTDLLRNYVGRNKADAEEAKKIAVDTKNAFNKESERIDNAGGRDLMKEATDEKKALDDQIDKLDKTHANELKRIQGLIDKQNEHNRAIGKSKSAIEDEAAASERATTSMLKDQADAITALLARNDLNDKARAIYEAELAAINKLIAKRTELGDSKSIGSFLDEQQEQIKQYTKQLEEAVQMAHKFDRGMTDAFGNVGKAIGNMAVALTDYAKRQNQIEQDKANALLSSRSDEERAAIAQKADRETVDNYLGGVAQMANAASNFFDKNSHHYKELQGISQAFHAAQMALLAIEITQNTIAAITKASAMMGPYGFIIMTGMLAGLGLAAGGAFNTTTGGDVVSAADRQKLNGTGSVLGDTPTQDANGNYTIFSQKSDSIRKSLELLQKNSDATMPISHSMLKSLQSIENAMSGVASILFRTAGITYGNTTGITTGTLSKNSGDPILNMSHLPGLELLNKTFTSLPLIGPILDRLQGLWGKISREVTDSGLVFNGKSLADYASGNGVSQYANVTTTESKLFGLIKDTNNQTITAPVEDEIKRQFSVLFSNATKAIVQSNTALGMSPEEAQRMINGITFSGEGLLSLRGLKGQDLQDALNAYISKMLDDSSRLSGIDVGAFQQVGEGDLQTRVRVASGVEQAKEQLDRLGISAINYTDILDKQGDVSGEIARQSILVKEGLTGVGKIMQDVTGDAKAQVDEYKVLLDIRRQLNNAGLNGASLSAQMIKGAGGQDALKSALDVYNDKFFSDAEKAKALRKNVEEDFQKLGTAAPKTRDDFRKMVQSISTSTDSGQKLVGQMLSLATEFDAAATAADTLTSAWKSLTDAMMDEVKKIRGIIDPSNPQNFATAQGAFTTATAQARAGDQTAAGKLPQLAEDLLTIAESQATSALELTRIRALTANSLEATAKIAGNTDPAKSSGTIDQSKIAAIIKGPTPRFADGGMFGGGMRLVGERGPELEMTGPSRILNNSQVQGMLTGSLADELRALRQEVAQMRAESNAQQRAIASNTEKMKKVLTRNDTADGILITNTLPS